MGNVWFAIPSKRPPEEAIPLLGLWKERGYNIALACDTRAECDVFYRAGVCDWFNYPLNGKYKGYAVAVNNLVRDILGPNTKGWSHPEAEWIVTGGDDTQPDLNHTAEEIAGQCGDYFSEKAQNLNARTWGVMQCTGDRWGESRNTHSFQKWPDHPYKCVHCGQPEGAPPHMHGAYIDRTCGSPWMGRSFCERINQGKGPLWPEYFHMGVDRELQEVATRLGILWQRPDLIHYHAHWGRKLEGKPGPTSASMPTFLAEANSLEQWNKYEEIFNARKAAGFPGSEPL